MDGGGLVVGRANLRGAGGRGIHLDHKLAAGVGVVDNGS